MLTYQSILHLHHLKSASKHVTIRCQTTTIGIARHIPNSFLHALSPNNETVSLALSQSQHASYLYALRTQIPVYSMEALESHPDSVFVEDTVVAVGDVAVITRMGHPSRRGECDSIKGLLRGLGLRVIDMRDMGNDDSVDESVLPCCDGGDVLYTGRHLFVGLSERTNKNGFRFLKKVFCEIGRLKKDDVIAVPPVIQGKEVLHLKSAVTHLDKYTLLAPEGPLGDKLLLSMQSAERKYTAIRLPDILSCNAVTVNGHVLAQDSSCQISKDRIEKACDDRGLGLTFVDTSELAKKDAALTCCSVLLSADDKKVHRLIQKSMTEFL